MEKRNTYEDKMKQLAYLFTMAIIGLIAGFFLGRDSVATGETIRYIKRDPIKKHIEIKVPYKVEIPTQPIYLYKTITDTVTKQIVQQVDTNAILDDWLKVRHYKENLFKNELGELSIEAKVQYNRLNTIDYSFVPIEKQVTLKQKIILQPFVEASYNTLNYVSVGGGVFYNDIGISLKYSTDFNKKGMDIGLKYKF